MVNCQGKTRILTELYHKALEKNLGDRNHFARVLEVGAGHGQHLKFVDHTFDTYLITDLNTQFLRIDELVQSRPNHLAKGSILIETADAESLQYSDNSIDRYIVTCVLLHLPHAEKALQEARRVVKDGGLVTLYLPSDPGFLYRWAQWLTMGQKLRKIVRQNKLEFDANFFRSLEHRGHALGISRMINHIFSKDDIRRKRFPLSFLSWNFSFYTVYQIQIKNKTAPG